MDSSVMTEGSFGSGEDPDLVRTNSVSSSSSHGKIMIPQRSSTTRSHSHSLLSSSSSAAAARKGVQAEAEHTKTTIDRASLSMPPPAKPEAERRFSMSSRPSSIREVNGMSRNMLLTNRAQDFEVNADRF